MLLFLFSNTIRDGFITISGNNYELPPVSWNWCAMSIIGWNFWGLGNLSVVLQLKYLVRYYKSDALFLSKTLVHSNKTDVFRYLLGLDNCFSISSNGRSGVLALFWQNSFGCTVLNYSTNHINVEVNDRNKGKWQFTGYYGFLEGRRRRASWIFLRNLANNSSLPWCILGDFNDILDGRENRGGAIRPRWLINGFRQAMFDAGLTEVYMKQHSYTGCRHYRKSCFCWW